MRYSFRHHLLCPLLLCESHIKRKTGGHRDPPLHVLTTFLVGTPGRSLASGCGSSCETTTTVTVRAGGGPHCLCRGGSLCPPSADSTPRLTEQVLLGVACPHIALTSRPAISPTQSPSPPPPSTSGRLPGCRRGWREAEAPADAFSGFAPDASDAVSLRRASADERVGLTANSSSLPAGGLP